VFYHIVKNIPKEYDEYMEELVFKSYFYKLDEVQRVNMRQLGEKITKKENMAIFIENEEDFELPPTFEYISKNKFVDDIDADQTMKEAEVPVIASPVKGCKCGKGKCGLQSECCPQLVKEAFAYKKLQDRSVIRLDRQEAIIECGANCKCDINCVNRATQQKRNINLCLFKTDLRGWGVKNGGDPRNKVVIKRGTFILEYTGELLGNHEASKRIETSYLYDLNMERKNHGFYTIDAYFKGNLARFVNHSCEPNCSMWFINDCQKDPKNQ
jgi:histone-lysine N-methyltransferase SUV39H